MTRPSPERRPVLRSLTLAAALATLTLNVSCKKEEPPPPPPKPVPRDTGPVTPEWQSVASTMTLDPRVDLSNAEYVGCTREQMEASFRFADAFVRGDAEALSPMLDATSREVLENLQEEGHWPSENQDINALVISEVAGAGSTVDMGFRIVMRDGSAMNLAWTGRSRGTSLIFEPSFTLAESPAATVPLEDIDADSATPTGRTRPQPDSNPRDPRRRIPQPTQPSEGG